MLVLRDGLRWLQRLNIAAASLLAISFVLGAARPVHSGSLAPSVVCYSVVTLENESDLNQLAARYHTTVEEIRKDNPASAPGSTITIRENTLSVAAAKASRGSGSYWGLPLQGRISSAYGWREGEFHHGLDFAVPSGTLVKATRPGRIAKVGWLGVYGRAVLVDHGDGIQSLYAHNSQLLVKVGQYVQGGQGIAYSGNTGRTTGPHLHFEIRLNGRTIDPWPYLNRIKLAEGTKPFMAENYF